MRYPRLSRFFSGKNKIEQIEQNLDDENELIAVITAALHEYMNAGPAERLEIVSIKRTGQTSPVWNRAGRFDHISRKL